MATRRHSRRHCCFFLKAALRTAALTRLFTSFLLAKKEEAVLAEFFMFIGDDDRRRLYKSFLLAKKEKAVPAGVEEYEGVRELEDSFYRSETSLKKKKRITTWTKFFV